MDIERWKTERGGILTRWIYAFAFKVDGVRFINYFLWIFSEEKEMTKTSGLVKRWRESFSAVSAQRRSAVNGSQTSSQE